MNLEYVPGLPTVEFEREGGRIIIEGQLDPQLLDGAEEAFTRLDTVFGGRFYTIFDGLRIAILEEGVEGGGQVDAARRYMQMNYRNNLLSVREAEAFLVRRGDFNPGERVRLVADPDKPAGVFPVELTHEVGHIVGEMAGMDLSADKSPTKYGLRAAHEAFAEAFLYFVYTYPLEEEVANRVKAAIFTVTRA